MLKIAILGRNSLARNLALGKRIQGYRHIKGISYRLDITRKITWINISEEISHKEPNKTKSILETVDRALILNDGDISSYILCCTNSKINYNVINSPYDLYLEYNKLKTAYPKYFEHKQYR